MNDITARIIGSGYAVPAKIRLNDDPIFDWIKKNNPNGDKLFAGYDQRHVLDTEENLIDIMLPAAEAAIKNAGIDVSEIDLLLGTGSISKYINPNELSLLHKELNLNSNVWVIPVDCEFSNFNASILMADSLIKSGRFKNALICVGGNWTRNVSYKTAQSISAADGAAAVVMSNSTDKSKWKLIDQFTNTNTSYYGSMYSSGNPIELSPPLDDNKELWTDCFFQITELGINGFKTFGFEQPAQAALQLMKNNNLNANDIALISHQASSVLMDHWNEVIKPAQYISSLKIFANMALANIPVTLSWAEEKHAIQKDKLILLAIGPDMHTNAMLIQRNI